MKRIVTLSLLAICLCSSCEKEGLPTENDEQANLQIPEYFSAKINGVDFFLTDADAIGGTVYFNPESGLITFDFWGQKEEKFYYEAIKFTICSYNGPGTYYTGNTRDVSVVDYLVNLEAWKNDYRLKDPGEVIISKASNSFVEGSFVFKALNYQTSDFVRIEGNFGVALE